MTSSSAPVVRLRGPADLLSSLPHLLGFHPTESLVVMCLSGPRRRQGLTMRMDLPDEADEALVAGELAERVAYERADSVVMICYTEAPNGGDELPRAGLLDLVGELLAGDGIEVHDAYLARGTRWWSYLCADPRCCPRAGTELPAGMSAAAGVLVAEAVWRGGATLPDRAALAASIAPVEEAAEGAVATVSAAQAGGSEPATPAEATALAASVLCRYREGRPGLSGHEVAGLRAGLRDVHVRDEIATWGLGSDRAMLLAVLTDLARATPAKDAAPACTLLAWVAYLDGKGALANVALERALDSDVNYSMALLLSQAMTAQMPPSAIRGITAAGRLPVAPSVPPMVRRQQPRRRSRRDRGGGRGSRGGRGKSAGSEAGGPVDDPRR